MKWVTAAELEQWANRTDFQGVLPELLGRLIFSSIGSLSGISFPSGSSITRAGWDGVIFSHSETPFISSGSTCWEVSCRKDVTTKANEDYDKRTQEPLSAIPTEATYVAVTARHWKNKEDWVAEKKENGPWKDVRAFDSDDLELWLTQSPSVAKWLAMKMGKISLEALALEEFWERWATLKEFTLTPDIVLLGRKKQTEDIKNWLAAPPSLMQIKADTKDESLAFLSSYIFSLPEEERDFWLSRSLIVNNEADLGSLLGLQVPHIIALNSLNQGTIDYLREKGHYIFVPLSREAKIGDHTHTLSRVPIYGLEEQLKKVGINEHESRRLVRSSGGSITVLRRLQGTQLDKPKWADPEALAIMLPVLLLGRWNENIPGDIKMVETLTGKNYPDYIAGLTKWLQSSDPPVSKIGSIYTVTSHLDIWLHLSEFLTPYQLQTFKGVCLTLLKEIHPKFELEPEKRYAAAIYDKNSEFSEVIREGIATTLVFFAHYSFTISGTKEIASKIISELLSSDDWLLWASLADILDDLAEASPDDFLTAAESLLVKRPDLFRQLFEEGNKGGFLGGGNYHCGLLWGLESIAWSKSYLGRVTLILGALAELDPGGKTANRPLNSLREIYLPWHPGNYVTPPERIQALKILLEAYPTAGWNLLIHLLPQTADIAIGTHRFKWHSFGDEEPIFSDEEYYEYLTGIMDCIVDTINVDNAPQRWTDLIPSLDHFSDEHRTNLISKLKEAFTAGMLENARVSLWNELKTLLNHHRSYQGTHWAMSIQEIEKLQEVLLFLEPTSLTDKYAWLYSNTGAYEYDDSSELTWQEKETQRAAMRLTATKELINTLSESELYKFILGLERPDIIGYSLADIFSLDERVEKTLLNIGVDPPIERFLNAFINKSFQLGGWEWADELIGKAKEWPPEKVVMLFLGFPANIEAWKRLEEFNKDIQDLYWKKANPHLYHGSPEEVEFAIKKLLECGRAPNAFDCVVYYPQDKKLSGRLIKKLLDEILKNPKDVFRRGGVDRHNIQDLFELLDESDEVSEAEIAQLEFSYSAILSKTKRQHRVIYGQLAKDPAFYAELISYAFLPENRDRSETHEIDLRAQELAITAMNIVDNCNIIPGITHNGEIEEEILLKWIGEVRQQAKALDRLVVTDLYIGHFLARVPRDADTYNPHEAICNVLQKLQNDDIDRGFKIEILNSCGTTMRARDDEGSQEKALAAKYEELANFISLRWPRVSKIMKGLAENYIWEAKRHQQEHELRQKDY